MNLGEILINNRQALIGIQVYQGIKDTITLKVTLIPYGISNSV